EHETDPPSLLRCRPAGGVEVRPGARVGRSGVPPVDGARRFVGGRTWGHAPLRKCPKLSGKRARLWTFGGLSYAGHARLPFFIGVVWWLGTTMIDSRVRSAPGCFRDVFLRRSCRAASAQGLVRIFKRMPPTAP